MRILSERPLNTETPIEYLRSWITANSVFFSRNQGEIMKEPIPLSNWELATFIGPHERFAWRQWQYVWEKAKSGDYTLMARTTDSQGHQQPMNAEWNVLGYGNNGVREHAVAIRVV